MARKGVIRWKVVRLGRGRMESAIVPPSRGHCCEYGIGEETVAPFGGCLVFRTREQAAQWCSAASSLSSRSRSWLGDLDQALLVPDEPDAAHMVILRAECRERVPLGCASLLWECEESCREAWMRAKDRGWPWAAGTEAYRYVTPLEVVT